VWEIYAIIFLVCLGFGVAILMARKTKAQQVIVQQSQVDPSEIAKAVAKAMTEELREVLKEQGPIGLARRVAKEGDDVIEIDESIIPMEEKIDVKEANLDNLGTEEAVEDKGLGASKSKLASILKKRK
jgi:phage terminase large subunit-like protein